MEFDSASSTLPLQRSGKRVFDVAVALVGLVTTLPIVVLAGLAILIDDRWPVLYRRPVLGLGGVPFRALKLRTMQLDADQWLERQPELFERYRLVTKLEKDPRVTRIGRLLRRFHVDELPQFLNVLAGQMSIVGPRMISPSELSNFGELGPARLSVRPGMTGLWQVAKSSYDYQERIALDETYLRNQSLGLDIRLTLMTIPSIFGWRYTSFIQKSNPTD